MHTKNTHACSKYHSGAKGFTLLEILVTVIILAIGLLGMAGLQLTGMRNNQSAYLRTQAALLAYDMGERMRANSLGFNNNAYDQPQAVEYPGCFTAEGCTVAEMAQNDAFEWSNTLATQLPMGNGVVCLDGTPDDGIPESPDCDGAGGVYVIKIWWDDSRSGTQDQRFVTSFQ